jgi:ankyrin repeat protein
VRDEKNNTALYYAVSNSYFDVAQLLIKLEANVNIKNSLGNTALHKAFMTKNMLMLNLLLSNGANISQLNDLM